MFGSNPKKTKSTPPNLSSSNQPVDQFQKLIDRYNEIKINDFFKKIDEIENLNVDSCIELMGDLRDLINSLLRLKSEAEICWKTRNIAEGLQKGFRSKGLKKGFKDEEQFNQFRDIYFKTFEYTAQFQNAVEIISSSLPEKKRLEKQKASLVEKGPINYAQTESWLTEDLAQFAGCQFKALSNSTLKLHQPIEIDISSLLQNTASLEDKRQAVGEYLAKPHQSWELTYILMTLKNVALAHQKNPAHWLSDAALSQQIHAKYNDKTCVTLFDLFAPKSTLFTINFFDPKKAISLQDQQVVADYYLELRSHKKSDRLAEIMKGIKATQEQNKEHKNNLTV